MNSVFSLVVMIIGLQLISSILSWFIDDEKFTKPLIAALNILVLGIIIASLIQIVDNINDIKLDSILLKTPTQPVKIKDYSDFIASLIK